jgi:hypothetical protein
MGKIRNITNHPKPDGGFWTSTELSPGRSQWTEWLEAEARRKPETAWGLEPDPNARIFHVRSREDEQFLRSKYPAVAEDEIGKILRSFGSNVIDWERVAKDYDAVNYQPFAGIDDSGEMSAFSMWDVESTLWMRWSFLSIEQVGPECRPTLRALDEGTLDLDGDPRLESSEISSELDM